MNRLTIFVIFIYSLAHHFFTVYSDEKNLTDEFEDSYFGIFISPRINMSTKREIALYWNLKKYHRGDKLGLYTEKPRDNLKPIFIVEPNVPFGLAKTGVEADFIPSAKLNFTKQCLKYHVAWLRSNLIIKENCLKTEPTWMADMKCILGNHKMSEIFLPGTHNSAAYETSPSLIQDFFYNKYIITQDEDVLGQLIYGTRYLDIRVCYRPKEKIKWWGCHGLDTVPLQTIINDVKTFLNNTNELVIFDVQEFSSEFNEDPTAHDRLIQFLQAEFEKYAIPYLGWYQTLNNIWSHKMNLIICYDRFNFILKHNILWPSVRQQWGNVQSIDKLYQYLAKIEKKALSSITYQPRSAMAQMTPNPSYIVRNIFGGLRRMTEEVNPNITRWYNNLWQHSANIVSVDFIKYSGIVDIALKWNYKRFNSKKCLR
ncbi:variant-surface-glycoprotein phospholipase C-like [Leptopilina boulardi]|uniref:variant-surface-glycoprotein phospholipase C-like n=1 Tax=Leptopilina boulardi TaxID=63433 RepID=UPI0021F6815F|nr:variant-surface-glycoprotein phospholipase C-like [Leptopilina boulardi]